MPERLSVIGGQLSERVTSNELKVKL